MTKRLIWILLLLVPLVSADDTTVIAVKDANFEVKNPNPDDWSIGAIDDERAKWGLKLHLVSEWADADPPGSAHVFIYAAPLGKHDADVTKLAEARKHRIEGFLNDKRYKTRGKSTVGGVACWEVDAAGSYGGRPFRLQWMVFVHGPTLYEYHVHLTNSAVDDEDIEAELKQLRDSLRFYKVIKPKVHAAGPNEKGDKAPAGGDPTKPIDPKKLARKEFDLEFWKVRGVKPKGLVQVVPDKLNEAETAAGCVFKARAVREQTRCIIRLFARSLKGGRGHTLDELAESKIEHFEKIYKAATRKDPVVDLKWTCALAKKSFSMTLVGRRTTTEINRWYFAECRNDRRYEIQIYVTGANGVTAWKEQVDDFLSNLKPYR